MATSTITAPAKTFTYIEISNSALIVNLKVTDTIVMTSIFGLLLVVYNNTWRTFCLFLSSIDSVTFRIHVFYRLCVSSLLLTIRQNSVWTMHGRVNRPAHTWSWKFPLQTNIVSYDEKTNRAIAIDHVTLNMYKHPIKSCLTRTPPEFNEWTKK